MYLLLRFLLKIAMGWVCNPQAPPQSASSRIKLASARPSRSSPHLQLKMFPLQFLSLFSIAVTTGFKEKKNNNKQVVQYDISIFKRGDLLEVPRTLFTHFGIYLGNNRVAHLIPDILPVLTNGNNALETMVTNTRLILGAIAKKASVRVDSVEDFAYGAEILVNHMDKVCSRPPLDGEEVARRAEKMCGSMAYSLLWYNCEHYVMFCRYGTSMSFQTCQFCKAVRKIVCSKTTSLISLLVFLFIMLYLESMSLFGILLSIFISFNIWMAS